MLIVVCYNTAARIDLDNRSSRCKTPWRLRERLPTMNRSTTCTCGYRGPVSREGTYCDVWIETLESEMNAKKLF